METFGSLGIKFVYDKFLKLKEQLNTTNLPKTYGSIKDIVARHIDHYLATLDGLTDIASTERDLINSLFEIKLSLSGIEERVISLKLIKYYKVDSIRLIQAIANLNSDISSLTEQHTIYKNHSEFAVLQTRLKKVQIDSGIIGLPFLFYVPISEETNLLSAPPIAHELGHIYSQVYEIELFDDFDNRYSISDFMRKAQSRLIRISNETKRKAKIRTYNNIILNWFEWRFEIASDVFATFLFGPAYALYMLSFLIGSSPYKKTGMVYTHPSPDLRMRLILKLLKKKTGVNNLCNYLKEAWSNHVQETGEDDEDTIDIHGWSEDFINIYVENICSVYDSLGLKLVFLPKLFYNLEEELLKNYEPKSLIEAVNLLWINRVLFPDSNKKELQNEIFVRFIL